MSNYITTGVVRFSYANVFTPKAVDDNSKEKYSVSLIISKDDKKTIKKLIDGIEAAKHDDRAQRVFGAKLPPKLKTPLRDGDEERPEDPAYANSWFINANSDNKPKIVDKNLNEIIDPDDFYSGCYGRASINFYAYNTAGNKGIACGLSALQKIKDGEPLGGTASIEDAFGGDNEFDEDDDF